jgi:ribosomal protein S18 acetylase RimI-like enzyme
MLLPYNPSFQKQVLDIADATLGHSYFTASEIQQLTKENALGIVSITEEKVAGFAFTLRLTTMQIIEKYNLQDVLINKKSEQKSAMLKTIAIHPNHQKKGLGAALLKATMNALKEEKIQDLYVIAWKSGNTINLGSLLSGFNFNPMATIPDYWYADSLKKNYVCPACGGPPCVCSALLYKNSTMY